MSYFLRTGRLGFRHWTAADAPLAIALWTDEDVMRHMGGPRTEAQAVDRLRQEMQNQLDFGFQYWPVFLLQTGEHAGCAGLKPWKHEAGVLEVGVHIARPFWSGRYGEEAARAAIERGFARPETTALMAGHGPQNAASESLICRLGFAFSHKEVWGPERLPHPFYRLPRSPR